MEDWNALTLASNLGQAAFETLLRGAAMLLATVGLILTLMGFGMLLEIGDVAANALPAEDEPAAEFLLMPVTQPNTVM